MNPTFIWKHYADGKIIGEIHRFIPGRNGKSKEDIPCYTKNGSNNFSPGIPDSLKRAGYPLFGINTIIDRKKMIFIGEGPKVQQALAGLGFQAVTSILGATNAHCSNWRTLNGCTGVLLLPDNDEPGKGYMKSVYNLLKTLPNPPKIYIVELPNLPKGGDACDWLKQQQELSDWNELESLERHPAREVIFKRLLAIIKSAIHEVPEDWATVQHGNSEWPDPKPIQSELLPIEALPSAMIPEPYRNWLADIAHRMQCPLDFVAIPAIVLTGTIIGAACGIKPKRQDDWMVVPNLWGGIVGRPGKLKSPAIAEPLKAIDRLAAKAKEEFDASMKQYSVEAATYKAQQDALRNKMLSAVSGKVKKGETFPRVEDVKRELANLEEPPKPVWHRHKTNDATIEKMSELLSENPRGMLLLRDELVGLLASWDKEGHESDRAFYLESWNGYGSIDTDRIGRGTIRTENLCVSVLGGIQPTKLTNYLYQAVRGFENDGLIQRFQLLAYPDDPKDWQIVDQHPDKQARDRAFGIIEKLSTMDFCQYGAILSEYDKTPHFRFSDPAQVLFYDWLTELETKKLKADDHPIILEHLSKYRSLKPSLALIFHLIEIADGKASGPVTQHAAEMAAAWCDYLESHARRIYGLVGDIAVQAAARLAKKIKEGKLEDGFTVRDVYHKEWGLLQDKETVQAACEELVEAGWLRAEVTLPSFGQKGKTTYNINPKIRGSHG